MRKVGKRVSNKGLWDMLKGIFRLNPEIESIESREDAKGAEIKLVLKRGT